MPKFNYLFKLLTFLIGLVIVLETISYLATRVIINKAVTQNARAELLAGGELFSRIMQKNAEQLALSVKVLTEDFGFKDAVATNDEKTIASALMNHSARVKADIGVMIGNDGKLVASDQPGVWALATTSSPWGSDSRPSTRKHRLVGLKKPRDASSQAVRTEAS